MSAWSARIREAKTAGDPSTLLELIPYATFLGLGVVLVEGELQGRLRFAEHLIGDSSIPALHGGTIAALLESTAITTVVWSSETVLLPKTITVTVDYLRPGRARDTFAAARITKQGRRVLTVRASAWQDDRERPIATADAHFLLAG